MSRREEYVGVRVIDHVTSDGPHWSQWLTEEPIVRCRDCERFAKDDSDHDYRSGWWCKRWNTDMVKPNGFCAWGERRDG